MQAFLKKHGLDVAQHSVKVNWLKKGRRVTISFSVQKRNASDWNLDAAFTQDYQKNWGLWNKDVVEAFLQLRSNVDDVKAPYLEIQLSPLGQPFALIITEPRKKFFTPQNLEFSVTSSVEERIWTGTMVVGLPTELIGEQLYGGFFSILSQDPREYFALRPNPEVRADFHQPELFLLLDEA
jgi:hypothetical protein